MFSEEALSTFLSDIVSALSNCALYSCEHPVVEDFSKKAVAIAEDLFVEDSLSLVLLADSFLCNGVPVSSKGLHINTFTKKLKAKGIEKVVIRKGVDVEGLKAFISALASREKAVSSSPNISIGILEVRVKAAGVSFTLIDESIAKVGEVYEGISRFRHLDMRGLDDVVVGFITALKKDARLLRELCPVKSYDVYTYVHESNVSVLNIFQAETLGLRGEALRDVGIAGLLHNVGKLFVSKDIIEKKTKLDDTEWKAMQLHPVYGALYLSALPEVPKLAVIAAYEHHMKYNGNGYPQPKRILRGQHLISQLVAISDFYDALRTERPYRPPFDVPVIISLLKNGSGKDFNPELVNNFITSLKKIEIA